MNFKNIVTAVTIFLTFLSFNSSAEDIYVCGIGCASPDHKAKGISMRYNQGDQFSVIDYNNDTAHTYMADKYFKYGEMFDRAIRISTSSFVRAKISNIKNVRERAKNLVVNVPSDLPNTPQVDNYNSSYILILQPQARSHIAKWLRDNASLRVQIETLVNDLIAGAAEKASVALDVRVRVTFENDSTGDFVGVNSVVNGSLTREYDYIEGSAAFADGSPLPTSLENVVGDWVFQYEGDAQGFIRLGALWGVSFTVKDRETVEVCTPTTDFVCRENKDGTVHCTTTRKCE